MKLRTHFLPKLTNREVELYLEEQDIIIIPVGTVETHGALPLDCETVLSEAFALKMAQKVNGLVLPHLPYFYAGATASARGTVQVSLKAGTNYLHHIAKSLLRQGFKRQIYLSFHAPAHMTIAPMVRDFFDETHVPILFIDSTIAFQRSGVELGGDGDNFNNLLIAGYEVLGKLDEVPLTTCPELDCSTPHTSTVDPFKKLFSVAYQSSGIGYYFGNPRDHTVTPRMSTPADRQKRADLGIALMNQITDAMDVPYLVEAMSDCENFYHNVVVPLAKDWIPGGQ